MAYTIGGISGCHINPAITLGVALCGRMSWKDALGYWVGQFIFVLVVLGSTSEKGAGNLAALVWKCFECECCKKQ